MVAVALEGRDIAEVPFRPVEKEVHEADAMRLMNHWKHESEMSLRLQWFSYLPEAP
jgi:hypothetical protein